MTNYAREIAQWKTRLEQNAEPFFFPWNSRDRIATSAANDSSDRASKRQPSNILGSIFRGWREKHHAAKTSRVLLKLYRDTSACHTGMEKRALYRLVVIGYLRGTPSAADEILESAEQSFSLWPVERELTFRDVVHYLAVAEYLSSDPTIMGTQVSFGQVVSSRIPANL